MTEPETSLLTKPFEFHRLTDDELRTFVDDFVSDRLFSLHHMSPDRPDDIRFVFIPLGLSGFSGMGMTHEDVGNIGTIYEYLKDAGPRSVNGLPCFFSMRIVHKDDWDRAREAIEREMKRRKEIAV